ncbi:hypothetical protein B0T16DRAFT_192101 [Cercophora newfieldiana]|uniref:Uncharacterized protein n=1 Tax=Cercophora newfieldiana TaxID=92897 RepID=A0AA40CM41_9PEZI|nr:hypothetical protein B0T16DRAFT_192101 [Cercophora newfieldiana]
MWSDAFSPAFASADLVDGPYRHRRRRLDACHSPYPTECYPSRSSRCPVFASAEARAATASAEWWSVGSTAQSCNCRRDASATNARQAAGACAAGTTTALFRIAGRCRTHHRRHTDAHRASESDLQQLTDLALGCSNCLSCLPRGVVELPTKANGPSNCQEAQHETRGAIGPPRRFSGNNKARNRLPRRSHISTERATDGTASGHDARSRAAGQRSTVGINQYIWLADISPSSTIISTRSAQSIVPRATPQNASPPRRDRVGDGRRPPFPPWRPNLRISIRPIRQILAQLQHHHYCRGANQSRCVI